MTKMRKMMAVLLTGAMVIGSLAAGTDRTVSAAAKRKPGSLTVKAGKKVLYVGSSAAKKKTTIKVTVKPAKSSKKVTFRSSNKKVLTVSSKGAVTARKKGKATVTVTSTANKKLKKKITFTVKQYSGSDTSVDITPAVTTTPDVSPAPDSTASAQPAQTPVSNATAAPSETVSGKPLTDAEMKTLTSKYERSEYSRVSVHDPSIVVGYYEGTYSSGTKVYPEQNSAKTRKEIYFIFGSHRDFAYSTDLKNWKKFTNNINTDYKTIFSKDAEWSSRGSSKYDVTGNLWAPDVIWNKSMGKWCMYMSVNGSNWYSSIVLLTSDSLNGDWTRQGVIVYSGFKTVEEAQNTDLFRVIGDSEGTSDVPSRYTERTNGNAHYSMNAIDPCVVYDDEGNLWMTYGSWFGGIYMLRLDAETGLRDYTYTYETKTNTSDAYQGLMLAGGTGVSGEASYIQKIGDKYYLWLSYGGLVAAGGYNMRVFSSDKITGPYKDISGHDARYGMYNADVINRGAGKINGSTGDRQMTYYKWNFMDYGYVAQGHNSAFVDADGKNFVVYHTRFNNRGEVHEVRVHQMFEAKNGGLVTAPFEYSGETLAENAYDTSDVTGTYHVLAMESTDYASLACAEEKEIQLKADGTVSGAYTGTWTQTADGPYLTITAGGITYQGVFITQNIENTNYSTMCFTTIGSNGISLWGYHNLSGQDAVVYAANELSISVQTFSGSQLTLPSVSSTGASYTWKSADTSVITDDGKVKSVSKDTTVTMNCTIQSGNYSYVKAFRIKVSEKNPLEMIPGGSDSVVAESADATAFNSASPSSKITESTGLAISFYLEGLSSDWDMIAHSSDNQYKMYLSILSYASNDYYEAKATVSSYGKSLGYTSATVWQAYLNKKCYVTISFNTDGSIAYYMDGNLLLTYAADETASWKNDTAAAKSPADIGKAVISYYKQGKLVFDRSVANIAVSYAADHK